MKKFILLMMLLTTSVLWAACQDASVDQDGYQKYTINFETNGGTSIESISIDENNIFSLDSISTTKQGYVFDGWYIDQSLETLFNERVSQDLTLYAKWLEIYTMTWTDDDGTVISTSEVIEGDMPVFEGETPSKNSDEDYAYAFDTWSPQIAMASEDQTYQATYTKTAIEKDSFDSQSLNDIFGFDIYSMLPDFETTDYVLIDDSDDDMFWVYLDFFDWTEDDAFDYIDLLDETFAYDDTEDSYILGDYYIYVYEDDVTYDRDIVYGFSIYGEKGESVASFDDAIDVLENMLSLDMLSEAFITMNDLENILIEDETNQYVIHADSDIYNNENIIDSYLTALVAHGWEEDQVLSAEILQSVYTYRLNETKTLAIYFEVVRDGFSLYVWIEQTSVSSDETTTLSNIESISDYEKEELGFSGLPSTGTYHVLVIPIEINGSDFPANYQLQLDLVFNGSSEDTGWQSVSSYYQTSSFNQLNITFDIHEKYETTYDAAYYENYSDEGDQYAISEAMLALDDDIDFSPYDTNDDGAIDSVIFVYSYAYDYDTNPWWAWVYDAEYGVADDIENIDGVDLEYYMWVSYHYLNDDLSGLPNLVVNAETYIHEMGHLLGFPDLYSSTHNYDPVGGWDMMSFNVGDHGPLNKLLYGWIQPELMLSGQYEITLDSYSLDDDGLNSAIIIPYQSDAFDDGDAYDEFLIIMFYTPDGLYEGHMGTSISLDQPGVVIYHANASLSDFTYYWGITFEYNNEGSSDLFLEILEADENDSLPSDHQSIAMSDLLTSGTLDLSQSYQWHDGTDIDVIIEVASIITNNSEEVTLLLDVS